MKKTFTLTHPKIKYARLVDTVRRDVKKYLKRERSKELPEGFDVWDFDCLVGPTAEAAEVITVGGIASAIDAAETEQLESVYIEIMARPSNKTTHYASEESND